jgi:hypothetical protein
MHLSTAFRLIAVSAPVLAASAQGALLASYTLQDHPDGNINPPPYGLRFDDIFASAPFNRPGAATFSFNAFDNVILSVFEDAPGDYRITIGGTVFGGLDVGATYGFGAGAYDLAFEYSANVAPSGTGWIVNSDSPLNAGTLTSQGNADVPNGTVFSLQDEFGNPPGFSFAFLQDEHRLSGYPQAGQGYFVGRGWMEGHSGSVTRDFLFIAVPTPGAGGALALGLALAGARRRRA